MNFTNECLSLKLPSIHLFPPNRRHQHYKRRKSSLSEHHHHHHHRRQNEFSPDGRMSAQPEDTVLMVS